jgi:hypothetical protein
MESTGILRIDDPVHMFTLHLVFGPRINEALSEFMEGFNQHKVRTEKNWSPYQMWLNGMLHTGNLLAQGLLDEEPDDSNIYGYDAQGPSSLGEKEKRKTKGYYKKQYENKHELNSVSDRH